MTEEGEKEKETSASVGVASIETKETTVAAKDNNEKSQQNENEEKVEEEDGEKDDNSFVTAEMTEEGEKDDTASVGGASIETKGTDVTTKDDNNSKSQQDDNEEKVEEGKKDDSVEEASKETKGTTAATKDDTSNKSEEKVGEVITGSDSNDDHKQEIVEAEQQQKSEGEGNEEEEMGEKKDTPVVDGGHQNKAEAKGEEDVANKTEEKKSSSDDDIKKSDEEKIPSIVKEVNNNNTIGVESSSEKMEESKKSCDSSGENDDLKSNNGENKESAKEVNNNNTIDVESSEKMGESESKNCDSSGENDSKSNNGENKESAKEVNNNNSTIDVDSSEKMEESKSCDSSGENDSKSNNGENKESASDIVIVIDTGRSTEKEGTAPMDIQSTSIQSDENNTVVNKKDTVDAAQTSDDKVVAEVVSSLVDKTEDIVNTGNRMKADVRVEMEEDSEDDGSDPFEAFRKKRPVKKKKKHRAMKIKISGLTTDTTIHSSKSSKNADTKTNINSMIVPTPLLSHYHSFMPLDQDMVEKELEDSLKFFEQPHEDQDPAYTKFQNKEKRDNATDAIKKINVEDAAGKSQIELIVKQQLQEKQESTERTIERYRMKIEEEYKKDLSRLQKAYQDKSRSNQAKINQGIAVLRKRHNTENQKLHQQHRQQSQARHIPEQIATVEWQQISHRLRQKHQRQMSEFSTKGNDVVNKCKTEFDRERLRLEKQYEKRKQDLNANRQSLYNRLYTGFQQLRQRYLKRHTQSIANRLEALELEKNPPGNETSKSKKKQSAREKAKSDKEERIELRPVSPIKTAADWNKESIHETSGAATRHKHRKGVLTQINRQLSVEIHNEGIWLSELPEKKVDPNKKKGSDSTSSTECDKKYFFPWGVTARKILESIVCGEIPHACDSLKLNFADTVAQNGGHVRCVMTDLRTSYATASSQRAEAIIEKEMKEIKKMEDKDSIIRSSIADTEKEINIIKKSQHELGLKLKDTLKELEKTKLGLEAFRTKYASYFGPDGKPQPSSNPSDARKLTSAGMKYRVAIENADKRSIAIRTKLSELQASLDKRVTNNKQGHRTSLDLNGNIKNMKAIINDVRSGRLNLVQAKSAENTTTRVKDTIDILSLTADMRRDQLNQKRNSSTSSNWVQSLPGLPGPLRRSLWYKMHRRRQQIVLRPTFTSMLTNMRNEIESKSKLTHNGTRLVPNEVVEAELIKAEQSYLLVTHPVGPGPADENIPSVPSSSVWAEPGWHLVLDVDQATQGDMILPCPPRQPLVQYNLSELYSAPGRQAASMINSTHLRSLESPLSAVATATSLAETDPAMAKPIDAILSRNDPLNITPEALKIGYTYSAPKTQGVRPTVQRRKSATIKDTLASPVSTKVTKKRQSVTSPLNSGISKSSGNSTSPNSTRVESARKRKSVTQSESSSTPRAAQRKRTTEPPRQISVDDTAFQPRPIMTQPQQQQPAPPPVPFNLQQQQQQQQQQQPVPQQQPNPYNNQFMNTMPSPVAPQQTGHRASFTQQQLQNTPQMNQYRMMQQQQQQQQQSHNQQHYQQHPGQQQKINYGQAPQQQAMRPVPQFFPHTQMNQQQPQQYSQQQQPMQIPGQVGVGPQGTMSQHMNAQQQQGNNPGARQQNMPSTDEQNDPLFMLKDM